MALSKYSDFFFIRSNQFKEENNEFKGYELVKENYIYRRNKINKNSIYFRCKNSECSGSITLATESITIVIKVEIFRREKFLI